MRISLGFGAALVTMALMLTPAASAAPFGVSGFDGEALQSNGETATQAGAHPASAATRFAFDTTTTAVGTFANEELKDATVDLPPGLLANPQAAAHCSETQLTNAKDDAGALGVQCPLTSQVGVFRFTQGPSQGPGAAALWNMQAPRGMPAELGFIIGGVAFHLGTRVRSGGDYGATVFSYSNSGVVPLTSIEVEVWGVPGDPSHDVDRGEACVATTNPSCHLPFPSPIVRPFFTLPTSCLGPVRTDLTVTSWTGSTVAASFLSHDQATPVPNPVGNTGCNAVDFSPSLPETKPTSSAADSPTGFAFHLHLPQNEDPNGLAEADLHEAVVTLPKGLVVNPSSGNGLDACTPAQIDLHGEGPVNCPNASKVGTVKVETPLLDHPLLGSVYIASPHENPFGSLLALYIVIDDPISGVTVKLAGEVSPDQSTGQLTVAFEENPQLPFEDLTLETFGGAAAPLRTPPVCGRYSTEGTGEESLFVPWTAPEGGSVRVPVSFEVTQGPNGRGCAGSEAALPNTPSFDGGSGSPISATYAPLVMNLRREDGSQQFRSVTVTPPPGLLAKLAGVPYCPDVALAAAAGKTGRAEQASPSCPAASDVGSVVAGAGAGPAPYYATGRAYLAGPYKGAPLSLAIVTPAVAGPFDLGTIVVRTALYVDPETARVRAVSDPIPTILQGIPLDVRSVSVKLDKPDFTLNPTSCNPMTFDGSLESTLTQVASLSNRFQVSDCDRLGFAPNLSLSLKGPTGRTGHPALTANVSYPQGAYANIARASVALPHSEFLDQAHIRTICTRVQFAADACPPGAVYGQARATTPLLGAPLEGPVYLRSSDHPLPDLVVDLHGQIRVVLVGRIDSFHGGIRTTFESVPDAPVSGFVLSMQGGKKGLLVNSRNICRDRNRATANFDAQNGSVRDLRPVLKAQCGRKHKRHHRR